METATDTSAAEPQHLTESLAPQQLAAASCPTCGSPAAHGFIYALGKIEARFPSQGVEKEFAQVAGRTPSKGKTDREMMQAVVSAPENRYLARQLCWVLTLQGLETYLLAPRDPVDFDLLIQTVRGTPQPNDLDVVIGLRGAIAPPDMCNGLMVPIVTFDQIYSFDRDALIKAIPRPPKMPAKEFQSAAEELFDRIMQITDNAGATDEHRALNYLRGSLSRRLRQDRRGICRGRVSQRGGGPPVAAQRRPADRRRDLRVHQPHDRRHRQVLRPRRHHRRVPVSRHEAVTLLRSLIDGERSRRREHAWIQRRCEFEKPLRATTMDLRAVRGAGRSSRRSRSAATAITSSRTAKGTTGGRARCAAPA